MCHIIEIFLTTIALVLSTSGCSGSNQKPDVDSGEYLQDCPNRPNCVSSVAIDEKRFIEPFKLKGDLTTGWKAIKAVIQDLPRTKIVTTTDDYIHTEFKSRLFRFIDDVELLLDKKSGMIDIRSASRIGYFDLGVNRRRVEALRELLIKNGLIY